MYVLFIIYSVNIIRVTIHIIHMGERRPAKVMFPWVKKVVKICYFSQTGVGDVPAAIEVECLEIRTSSCYFQYTGIGDFAVIEVERSEIRTSSCYFQHTGVGDDVVPGEVECSEFRKSLAAEHDQHFFVCHARRQLQLLHSRRVEPLQPARVRGSHYYCTVQLELVAISSPA